MQAEDQALLRTVLLAFSLHDAKVRAWAFLWVASLCIEQLTLSDAGTTMKAAQTTALLTLTHKGPTVLKGQANSQAHLIFDFHRHTSLISPRVCLLLPTAGLLPRPELRSSSAPAGKWEGL